jgi:MarR family transcriptional regulator, organic hydroperoxide resistance regulator
MNGAFGVQGAARAVPPLGCELDFLRLVWGVVHGLDSTSKRMERATGITAPQRFVIGLLGRFPGITPAQVAVLLQVHPSTVSGIVKRLESRGLVLRRPDTRDRRRAYLGLTAAGHSVDTTSMGTVETAVQRALAPLAPSALEAVRAALAALARELAACDVGPSGDGDA